LAREAVAHMREQDTATTEGTLYVNRRCCGNITVSAQATSASSQLTWDR
jgi:hypothetical protein